MIVETKTEHCIEGNLKKNVCFNARFRFFILLIAATRFIGGPSFSTLKPHNHEKKV